MSHKIYSRRPERAAAASARPSIIISLNNRDIVDCSDFRVRLGQIRFRCQVAEKGRTHREAGAYLFNMDGHGGRHASHYKIDC